MIFELLLFGLLLAASAFFSSTETALFSFSYAELLRFRKSKDLRLALIARLMKTPNQVLTSLLIGNNAVNIMVVLVASRLLSRVPPVGPELAQGAVRIRLEALGITVVLLLVSEILPKSIALRIPMPLARINVMPFWFYHQLIGILRLRTFIAFAVKILLGVVHKIFGERDEHLHSGDLKLAVEFASREGHLSELEANMMDRALSFQDHPVEDIMVARAKVPTIAPGSGAAEGVRLAARHKQEYLVVYDSEADQVVGVMDVDKAIRRRLEGTVDDYLSTPVFVPKVNAMEALLDMLQPRGEKILMIVDEFGAFVGVVTIKDLLIYLAGTERRVRQTPLLSRRTGGYTFSGEEKLSLIEEQLQWEFPKGEYVTLGGLLTDATGRIPRPGEWLVVHGRKFYIDEGKPNKIEKVFIPRQGT